MRYDFLKEDGDALIYKELFVGRRNVLCGRGKGNDFKFRVLADNF